MSVIDPREAYDKGGISTRDFITAKELDYIVGNIIKYGVRHKEKNGKEDWAKLLNYAQYGYDNYERLYEKD